MIEKINLNNILFLDIETVPEVEDFNTLDDEMKALWELKTQYQRKDEYTPEDFYDRAGIWAEFGKIVCISVGYFTIKGDIRNFRVTSFFGEEKKILNDFINLLIIISISRNTFCVGIMPRNSISHLLRAE